MVKKAADRAGFLCGEDASGSGGILTVRPSHEPGELDEVWETQKNPDPWLRESEQLVAAGGADRHANVTN